MADGASETRLHATAIGLGEACALIRGPSGSGKSDLALRCLATPPIPEIATPAYLVADDQVIVTRTGLGLLATPPGPIAGLIEVRGIGILPVPYRAPARVDLIVELVNPDEIERLPDPWPVMSLLGLDRPVLKLSPFEASAPLKLLLALALRPWDNRQT